MTFVRHRDRMVQESVQEDLVNTLIACRWMPGTTTRPVVSPYAPSAGFQVVTTAPEQVLKAVKGSPVVLVDYFPEATTDEAGRVDVPESGHTAPNTLAMDDGEAGEVTLLELGSNLMEVPYRFTFAFSASSVGVAQAVLKDLRDRYLGNLVNGDMIPLYDYNTDPDVTVVRMEVDDFVYRRAGDDEVAPYQATLYYAQLTLTDIVDDASIGKIQIAPTDPIDDTLEGDLVLITAQEQVALSNRLTYNQNGVDTYVEGVANAILEPASDAPYPNSWRCLRDGLYIVSVDWSIGGAKPDNFSNTEHGFGIMAPDFSSTQNYKWRIELDEPNGEGTISQSSQFYATMPADGTVTVGIRAGDILVMSPLSLISIGLEPPTGGVHTNFLFTPVLLAPE